MKLEGTNAIVTGASRGIGARIADALAERGVNLALAARTAADLEDVAAGARARGVTAVPIATDVTESKALRHLVDEATSRVGPIDLLVNNAGFDHIAHFASIAIEDIELMFRTNVLSAEILTRLVVPGMIERRRGHIVNMGSASGKMAVPYMTVYSSTKHALVGFSWSLREELREYGVGVSVVCPAFVKEDGLFARWNPSGDTPAVARPVPIDDVVRSVIDVIENDRAEAIVARGLGRVVDIAHAVSVDGAMRVPRRGGVFKMLRREASKNSDLP